MAEQGPKKVTSMELLRIREKQWAGRLRGYSLVAELEVKEDHWRQVARVLGGLYAKHAGTEQVGRMFVTRPACVAVAITGIAARDYERGELWPRLWKGLGYQGHLDDRAVWGHGFLTALEELGLPTFPELPMPYLGPMLMHTGIPTYCLEDYFRLIAHRRTVEPGLDAGHFLDWATGRPHRLNELDMPAQRFLKYGSDYAFDFVDRTFDLLDRLRAPAPDLDGVGLPTRVMEHAQRLAAEGRLDLRAMRSDSSARTRSERPRIALDPFGRGVEVVLPAVGDTPDGVARWRVTADGVSTTVRSQAQWEGSAEAVPATTFPLLRPVRTVVVAMDGWDHETELNVVDPGAPMLVFTEDGRRVAANLPLPPDNVWVAYPAEEELTADGEVRVTVEGQLPLGWNGWRLQQVSLERAQSLGLSGFPASRRPVRGFTRPRISTGAPVPGVTTPYGTPVHARVPEIWLPAEAGAKTAWTIDIRPSGGGPGVSETREITESCTVAGLWDALPRPLLGSFDIAVRGPLGRGAARTVFIAEGVGVSFTPAVRLFDVAGLTNARAEISAPVGAAAHPRTVSFGPAKRAAVIEFRAGQESEPLVIRPPHLQVMHERPDESLIWRAGPLRIPAEVFAEDPGALLVQVPGATTVPPLLVCVGDQMVQDVPPSGRPQNGTARYDLTRIIDTVTEHQRAALVLDLGRQVRVAYVRPRRLADRVERDDDGLRLIDCAPIEGLTAGVYVKTAPWREPLVVPVTEDGFIRLPDELRHAGTLFVVLQVDDPWTPAEWPDWPEKFMPSVGDGYLIGDDVEETALARFIAGAGEFPEHVGDLRRVWTMVRLAPRLRIRSEQPRFLAACARPIRHRPLEAISALADLGLEPGRTTAAVISSGLAATAVPDPAHAGEARRLWPVAPVLAALAGGLRDPDCFEAAEQQCGTTLTDIKEGGGDPHAAIGRFGPEAELMVHMEPRRIESIWRAAQVVPQALLDPDTRLVAARRLFDRRENPDVKSVGRGAKNVVHTALALLKDRPELTAQVEARRNPKDRGGWFALPAASAALAVLARLAARGDTACRDAEQLMRADWARLADVAPDLITIDLILAELLVGLGRTETQ
ncbi:hypothetical protein [Actinoallomurus soli]|uniref:hypothetical protein n=1 Tax=Actinoallomurus soli TaxID=2952535 RepID=UPI0020925D84|nr:hypothetical protein [Actinoallomurus soli]MCO5968941.1 hypothetical protein [Actinoallomurus soli]